MIVAVHAHKWYILNESIRRQIESHHVTVGVLRVDASCYVDRSHALGIDGVKPAAVLVFRS